MNTLRAPFSLTMRAASTIESIAGANRLIAQFPPGGLVDTVARPEAAIDALLRRAPGSDRAINQRRLAGTLAIEMAHPEGRRIGIGDMDDERLQRLIERIVRVKRLPRTPGVREVFDRRFLPPLDERVRSLAG